MTDGSTAHDQKEASGVSTEPLTGMRVGKNSQSDIPTLPDAHMVLEYRRRLPCIPDAVPTLEVESQGRVVALDPGIDSFQTLFSEMTCGQIRTGDFAHIARPAASRDDLLARLKPNRKENRFNARKRYALHCEVGRNRDLVDELHWKMCRFLVQDFNLIVIPGVEIKDMALRCKRNIRKKSARSPLTFSLYRFKQRLKAKASECGKVVPEVDEAYTSKTASWTGEIKKIGGAKYVTTSTSPPSTSPPSPSPAGHQRRARYQRCPRDFPAGFGRSSGDFGMLKSLQL